MFSGMSCVGTSMPYIHTFLSTANEREQSTSCSLSKTSATTSPAQSQRMCVLSPLRLAFLRSSEPEDEKRVSSFCLFLRHWENSSGTAVTPGDEMFMSKVKPSSCVSNPETAGPFANSDGVNVKNLQKERPNGIITHPILFSCYCIIDDHKTCTPSAYPDVRPVIFLDNGKAKPSLTKNNSLDNTSSRTTTEFISGLAEGGGYTFHSL